MKKIRCISLKRALEILSEIDKKVTKSKIETFEKKIVNALDYDFFYKDMIMPIDGIIRSDEDLSALHHLITSEYTLEKNSIFNDSSDSQNLKNELLLNLDSDMKYYEDTYKALYLFDLEDDLFSRLAKIDTEDWYEEKNNGIKNLLSDSSESIKKIEASLNRFFRDIQITINEKESLNTWLGNLAQEKKEKINLINLLYLNIANGQYNSEEINQILPEVREGFKKDRKDIDERKRFNFKNHDIRFAILISLNLRICKVIDYYMLIEEQNTLKNEIMTKLNIDLDTISVSEIVHKLRKNLKDSELKNEIRRVQIFVKKYYQDFLTNENMDIKEMFFNEQLLRKSFITLIALESSRLDERRSLQSLIARISTGKHIKLEEEKYLYNKFNTRAFIEHIPHKDLIKGILEERFKDIRTIHEIVYQDFIEDINKG